MEETYLYKEKLRNFPPINFISISESYNRREVLYKQFEDYEVGNITPHIFERYNPDKHIVHSIDWWAKDKEGYLGCTTSHLKAIKRWYENTNEQYAFFCEDDISFDSVKYWNFTWKEFFDALPSDWSCVQLVLFRNEMFKFFQPDVHFRHRCWCDWSSTGYIITRNHAKNLLDHYYDGETFWFEYMGTDKNIRDEWAKYPTTETIMFSIFDSPVYIFPLFVENPNLQTTVWDLNQPESVPSFHWPCYNQIINWWESKGCNTTLNEIFDVVNTLHRFNNPI
jgi:GR25 family glycosyltransferase involved in LPS biosynthesis